MATCPANSGVGDHIFGYGLGDSFLPRYDSNDARDTGAIEIMEYVTYIWYGDLLSIAALTFALLFALMSIALAMGLR